MEKTGAVVVAAVLGLALEGCGEYPLKESQIEAAMPERIAPIVVGETDRAVVRRLLGTPLAASDHWQFDLIHVTDKNSDLIWIFVPVGFSSQEVSGYVLVTYDERGVVAGYTHGFAREPSAYRSDPGEEAHLVAGDVQFAAGKKTTFVAVSADRRDSYLSEHAASERCRVVIGCAPSQWCFARLRIDGNQQVDSPVALTGLPFAVAVQELVAGEHSIEATPALVRVSFAGATKFMCPAGETRFIALELSPDDTKGVTVWRRHLFATFTVSAEMPEALRSQPLLIWGNGQWLVPQEPKR
jgi:hypothetical protein